MTDHTGRGRATLLSGHQFIILTYQVPTESPNPKKENMQIQQRDILHCLWNVVTYVEVFVKLAALLPLSDVNR